MQIIYICLRNYLLFVRNLQLVYQFDFYEDISCLFTRLALELVSVEEMMITFYFFRNFQLANQSISMNSCLFCFTCLALEYYLCFRFVHLWLLSFTFVVSYSLLMYLLLIITFLILSWINKYIYSGTFSDLDE